MKEKKDVFLCITACEKANESEKAKELAEGTFRRVYGRDAKITHHDSGKPRFEGENGIFVSLSHGDGLCAAAISESEIGVDTELMKGNSDRLLEIARRYFTKDEIEYTEAKPVPRFYEIWCKKESYVKYTGKGISSGLSKFSVLNGGGIPDNVRFFHLIYENHMLALCSEAEFDGKVEYIKIK